MTTAGQGSEAESYCEGKCVGWRKVQAVLKPTSITNVNILKKFLKNAIA